MGESLLTGITGKHQLRLLLAILSFLCYHSFFMTFLKCRHRLQRKYKERCLDNSACTSTHTTPEIDLYLSWKGPIEIMNLIFQRVLAKIEYIEW